jgi:hypothetical protein
MVPYGKPETVVFRYQKRPIAMMIFHVLIWVAVRWQRINKSALDPSLLEP